jgi:hypothetical protein
MYTLAVKAITITVPEELDRRAAAEARRRGISKSELIRRGLDTVLPVENQPDDPDPWYALSGFGSPNVSTAPGDIDQIVYGD